MAHDKMVFVTEDESPNYPVPVPELAHIDHMDVNVVTREIFVSGEIDEDFGPWFTCVMQYLEQRSDDPVTIWINTPGGNETSMFVFHDLVRATPLHVTTIGTGQVCSAGVLMLACGNTRLVTESCVLMSHRGRGGVDGDMETIQARLEYIEWSEKHWSRLMERYTPDEVDGRRRDFNYWFQLGKKRAEFWLLGGEAIVHEGIADALYLAPHQQSHER